MFRCAVLLLILTSFDFAYFDIHVDLLVLVHMLILQGCLGLLWVCFVSVSKNGCTCFLEGWGSLAPSRCQGNTGRWKLDWSPP